MADVTIIAPDTSVSGRIQGQTDLSIQGRVEGTIHITETVTVEPQGQVRGELNARQVIIEGSFEGNIQAQERVILGETARAFADIQAPLIEMASGAQLKGELTIGAGELAAPVQRPATSTSRQTTTAARRVTTASTASARPLSSTRPSPAVTPRPTTPTPAPAPAPTAAAAAPVTTTTTTVVVEEPTPEPEPEPEAPILEEEALEELREDYTVKELRDELRRRDLAVSGTKDELIERLLKAQAEENA